MKVFGKLFFLSLSLIICVSMFSMSCGENGQAKDKEETAVLIPVEVAEVSQDDISAFLTGTSTLEAEEEAEVVAKTSGIVEKIFVEEGMFVKKGQILVQLEEDMLAIEMEKARADLNKLENDFERNKELFQKNLISKEEFQSVRFQYDAQKAAFEKTKLNLAYASIRAPITGVVAKRHIKTGNMINLNQPVFTIVGFDELIANLYVPEVDMKKVSLKQLAELTFDASNGTVFNGFVDRISPIVDPNSGTVKVTIAVRDGKSHIKPGMFARVRIIYDTRQNILLVPKQAVITEDGSDLVYAIQDSMAVKKSVKTGYSSESMVEIVDGLNLGDQVVVVGQNGLKDSSKVEIVQ